MNDTVPHSGLHVIGSCGSSTVVVNPKSTRRPREGVARHGNVRPQED